MNSSVIKQEKTYMRQNLSLDHEKDLIGIGPRSKEELNIALGTKNRSYLRTDLGSRFGVNSFNGRAIVLYQDCIKTVLRNGSRKVSHITLLRNTLSQNRAGSF